jgi:gluconate 2-dehydrogenase gamma chain
MVAAMSNNSNVSRRRFLKSTSALSGASLLRIGAPTLIAITEAACSAKQESSPFVALNAAEAADFAAIAARIMPTTETPGANEAGVIYFIDRALGAELQQMHGALRAGLDDLNSRVAEQFSDKSRFSELEDGTQDQLLTTIEDGDFFDDVWKLTMSGFFAMSSYGGNRDNIAWKLIDFKGDHGAWEYPFGYYDAEYMKEKADG